ncbi:MAG: hypothetical protein ACKPKO_16945, partial [Candidatus Fonsibacter sp.]
MTKESDFTDKKTVENVIKTIRGVGDVFFYCSPCTGGSSWKNLNLELAKRRGWTHTVVNLIGHLDLHWRLWQSLELVARHCAR